MNKLFSVSAIAIALAVSGTALAGHKHGKRSYEDTADVISVTPIYRTVHITTPHRECWRERRARRHHHRSHDTYTAPITGAILGGVIGNQFGKGSGKDAMTVGGALLGAAIGHDVKHAHHRPGPRFERHCEFVDTHDTREELDFYRVKYRYQGETYRTRMDYDPGDTIRVRVSVDPLG